MLHAFVSEWNTIAAAVWAALFNSLPAVCILTGCVWLLLDRVKGWSAATRYAGWCGILVMAIGLPTAQFFLPHAGVATNEIPVTASAVEVGAADMTMTPAPVGLTPPMNVRESPVAPVSPYRLSAGGGILLLWVLAILVQLTRLRFALRHNFVLKRSAFMPGEEMDARWRELLRSNGDIRRTVTLALSSRITMPAVVGYLRPVVLLPGSLVARLSGDQVDGILLHELAHVRRRDDWAIAVQRFLEAVFALHPLIHLITSKMELQREIACDDWVLRTQQPRVYASSLTSVAEFCLRPVHSGLMGLAMESPSQLGERVELLLDNTRTVATGISWKWMGSFVSALGLACLVSLQLPEVMAFPVQATPAKPSKVVVAEPMPVPVVAPVEVATPIPVPTPVPLAPPQRKHTADSSKELAREQAELSAKQRELGRKQAELARKQLELARQRTDQIQLQVQQRVNEQLEPQMRRLQEQLSHMNLDQIAKNAAQMGIHTGELEAKLAKLQWLEALSHDGAVMGKQGRLSDEDLKKLHALQARYRAQAAALAAQQEKAAKEFSRNLSQIINDAMTRAQADQKK